MRVIAELRRGESEVHLISGIFQSLRGLEDGRRQVSLESWHFYNGIGLVGRRHGD